MKRIPQKLSLVVFSILVTVLVLEIIFRLLSIQPTTGSTLYVNLREALEISTHPFYPNYSGDRVAYYLYKYKPDAYWATEYPSNERGYFNEYNQVVYLTNTDGYRDEQFQHRRRDVFRIIAIGDSMTLGEGVRAEDIYAKVTEAMLRSEGLGVEVYNLGVNGYGIRDEAASLEAHLRAYHPDFVIWGYGLNDISHAAFDEWIEMMDKSKGSTLFDSPSLFLNFVQERIWKLYSSREYTSFVLGLYQSPKHWTELTSLLRYVHRTIREQQADLLVLVLPHLDALDSQDYAFAPVHDLLAGFFKDEGLNVIDFTRAFGEHGARELRVHEVDGHPNEIAHRIVAQEIVRKIKSVQGLRQ